MTCMTDFCSGLFLSIAKDSVSPSTGSKLTNLYFILMLVFMALGALSVLFLLAFHCRSSPGSKPVPWSGKSDVIGILRCLASISVFTILVGVFNHLYSKSLQEDIKKVEARIISENSQLVAFANGETIRMPVNAKFWFVKDSAQVDGVSFYTKNQQNGDIREVASGKVVEQSFPKGALVGAPDVVSGRQRFRYVEMVARAGGFTTSIETPFAKLVSEKDGMVFLRVSKDENVSADNGSATVGVYKGDLSDIIPESVHHGDSSVDSASSLFMKSNAVR